MSTRKIVYTFTIPGNRCKPRRREVGWTTTTVAATANHGLQRAARISAGVGSAGMSTRIGKLTVSLRVCSLRIRSSRISEPNPNSTARTSPTPYRRQGKLEAIGKNSLVRKAGRIDDAELCALLLAFQTGGQRGGLLLGEQSVIFLSAGCRNRASCRSSELPPPGLRSAGRYICQSVRDAVFARWKFAFPSC